MADETPKNSVKQPEPSKEKPVRNPEADQKFAEMQANCAHDAGMSQAVHQVFVAGNTFFIISTVNCLKCGWVFHNGTQMEAAAPGGGIAVPNIVLNPTKN